MLTLYYGTDDWRLRQAARRFVDDWRITHGNNPLMVYGGQQSSGEELGRLLKYPSLFQARSAAVVHSPLGVDGMGELLSSRHEDTDILLVQLTTPKQTSEKKQALSKYAKLADTVETFEPLQGMHLASWVREFVAAREKTVEPAAVVELVERAGNESWRLANELEKVCAYTSGVVTVETVRLLVGSMQHTDEWELSNTIASCDKRAAVSALFRQVRRGTPEPLLIGTFASAFRTLLLVRDLIDRGSPPAAIAKTTGLHLYVVTKTLRGATQYSVDKLRAAHWSLAALDRHYKEGSADVIDGLFSTLLAL